MKMELTLEEMKRYAELVKNYKEVKHNLVVAERLLMSFCKKCKPDDTNHKCNCDIQELLDQITKELD